MTHVRSLGVKRPLLIALVVGIALVAGGVGFVWSGSDRSLEAIERVVRTRFPNVRQLDTASLEAWLADASRPSPLLLDVRTAAENAVSHLPNARWVEPDGEVPAWLLELPRGTPIVAYCAVGYRSSAYVERLSAAGFTSVRNLEGSIFAWANEGRRLEQGGAPADVVHPFDATWGRLLDPARRAPLDAPLPVPSP